NLKIEHVAWYVASTTATPIELENISLMFDEPGAGSVGGAANTNEGIVSTRRGNAGAWTTMIGRTPVGRWTLSLPDTQAVRPLFRERGRVEWRPAARVGDVLLVITFAGRTPSWPI